LPNVGSGCSSGTAARAAVTPIAPAMASPLIRLRRRRLTGWPWACALLMTASCNAIVKNLFGSE
jgi:hypothetical protein